MYRVLWNTQRQGGALLLEVVVLEGMEGVAVPVGPASSVCGGLSH